MVNGKRLQYKKNNMITPQTLLDSTISIYEKTYTLNYSNVKFTEQLILADAITWVNRQLFVKNLISKEEYNSILKMIHSKDKENLAVAEQIIRNLNLKL